jgi:hypothetical protein
MRFQFPICSCGWLVSSVSHPFVKSCGPTTWYAEGLPALRLLACQCDNLAHMIHTVGELPKEFGAHAQRLSSEVNRSAEVRVVQPSQFVKDQLPTRRPACHEGLPSVFWGQFELRVSISMGLLTVGCEKVRPTGCEVPGHVFGQDRYAVTAW